MIPRPAVLRLTVRPERIHAEARRGAAVVWEGETAYGGPDDISAAIARLATALPVRCDRMAVTLEPPLVQLRTLAGVPPVNARALTALVGQQPGRYFRKNGVPLVTAAAWTDVAGARVARAAAVEEPWVEAVAAGAGEAGLRLESITPPAGNGALSLLPSALRTARGRIAANRLRRLILAALAAWIIAGAVLVTRLVVERRRVDAELRRLQAPLGAVLAARRELRDAAATVSAVTEADARRRQALAALATLARTLPDSAVATSLQWSLQGWVLGGLATRAGAVRAGFERAGFAAVRFEGPVVREPLGGREWERFTLLFADPVP